MDYLTKMNGKSGQNGFSVAGLSILGQAPSISAHDSITVNLKGKQFLIEFNIRAI